MNLWAFCFMAREGFNGQWVEICRTGEFTDSAGVRRQISRDFLAQAVTTFDTGQHEPPIVVGHPADNAPAYGWTRALRLQGDRLEAQFGDTDDNFEAMVRDGRFRKRSASFYLQPPSLRHVGFLGAQPPAVKGLREIALADGACVTVEISLSEETMAEKETPEEKLSAMEWVKRLLGGAQPAPAPAPPNFSEVEAQRIADAAIAATKAEFTEQLKAVQGELATVRQQIATQGQSATRTEILSFVESLGAARCPPAFKRAGVVEFLEALAVADASDKEPAVVAFSEGENGQRAEHKFSRLAWMKDFLRNLPPFVQFGEQFGGLKVSAAMTPMVDPNEVAELRQTMGVKEGGK